MQFVRESGRFVNLALFGYKNARDILGKGIIVINPERGFIVQKIFTYYLAGIPHFIIHREVKKVPVTVPFLLDPAIVHGRYINKSSPGDSGGALYPGLDSNQHTMRHCHLKTACLPISPPGLEDGCKITYSLHISTMILQKFLRKFISHWTC